MSDGDGCSILELLFNELLDLLLGDHIDVSSSFVENHDSVSSQDGSHDANQLLFTDAEGVSLLLYLANDAAIFNQNFSTL